MHVRAFALAAAALAGFAAAARADLVTAQSVVALTNGSAILNDNFFPFSFADRASVLDGLNAIDVTLSAGGNDTEEWFVIQYGPGSPAGEVAFVIAPGANTAFVSLVHLDFYRAGDYSPSADAGRRASIDVSRPMIAGNITDLRFAWTDLTLNGGMQIGELAAYDSVRAIFRFQFQNTSRLTIDAISNPEPGTLALFALGAVGLGGLAWRRRNARIAAK